MTAPLIQADADLRDFHFMPLDVARLINSDLAAIATGDEFKAAVMLWCKCWHQIPASSLPNDDRLLAHLAGFGKDVKGWLRVKEMALKGFVLCDDGRLYHPVVAEKAAEALKAKLAQRERTAAATAARLEKKRQRDERAAVSRNEERDVSRDVPRDDPCNVHQGTGTGTGTGIEKKIDDGMIARATFDETERAIRGVPELAGHPVTVTPVIAPIWSLIGQGFDLHTQIMPSIRRQAANARRPIKTWAYFVDGIVQDATPQPAEPTGARSYGSSRRPSGAQQLRDAIADVQAAVADGDPAP